MSASIKWYSKTMAEVSGTDREAAREALRLVRSGEAKRTECVIWTAQCGSGRVRFQKMVSGRIKRIVFDDGGSRVSERYLPDIA